MKHCIASFFRLRHPGALHHELLTLPVEDPGRICNLDHVACLKKRRVSLPAVQPYNARTVANAVIF